MQRGPTALAQCSHVRIGAVEFRAEFSNGKIANIMARARAEGCALTPTKSDVRRGDIYVNCVVTDALQVKLTNNDWTQKWGLNLIDAGDESLLASKPPDPQTNAVGNSKWCEHNRQKDDEQEQQNTQNEAIP